MNLSVLVYCSLFSLYHIIVEDVGFSLSYFREMLKIILQQKLSIAYTLISSSSNIAVVIVVNLLTSPLTVSLETVNQTLVNLYVIG